MATVPELLIAAVAAKVPDSMFNVPVLVKGRARANVEPESANVIVPEFVKAGAPAEAEKPPFPARLKLAD